MENPDSTARPQQSDMNHHAKIVSVDEKVRSVWLVIFMAVTTSALRIAIWAGNEITL